MVPAEASFAPVRFTSTRDRVAAICGDLGSRASLIAGQYEPGQYGCADTETGNVVVCESTGDCTLYFGPRLVLADLNRPVSAA